MKASVEEWARRIIQAETGKSVVIHDDGSKNGMYDLRIGPADAPTVAIECVGAVDQAFTETWNVGPARGPFHLQIQGDWNVTVKSGAHIKTIKKELEQLLLELERQEIYDVRVDYRLKRHSKKLFDSFEALQIEYLSRYRENGTGKVQLVMPGIGGAEDTQGHSVPGWISDFLRDTAQKDVLDKLQRSGAPECHVFIPVSSRGASWSVISYLTGKFDYLPNQSPSLLSPVMQVWIISTVSFSKKGIRWDGANWCLFDTENI